MNNGITNSRNTKFRKEVIFYIRCTRFAIRRNVSGKTWLFFWYVLYVKETNK